ncbi:uncharacterized protein LOC127043244 [Gopherus flavomarginatus]|uniref:uncharacterized protein LOC127043244 n=1 Tax=Gopherus flavomarginatus TaxID=286002 RepID=UPI0021CBE4B7|nr:uncharacterized protein LOC127043244 [Gopherus flavomarginatus]
MEATSAANFSSLPTPSRRLAQIRRRKKRTRDEMFTEIMAVTCNERAHLGEWKDVVAKYRKNASEREDRRDKREDRRDARDERWRQEDQRCRQEDQRWRDATLELLLDQTDILQHLVDLQEEQRGHRMPLQPMFNHPQIRPLERKILKAGVDCSHSIFPADYASFPQQTHSCMEAEANGLNPENEVVDEEVELKEDVGRETGLSGELPVSPPVVENFTLPTSNYFCRDQNSTQASSIWAQSEAVYMLEMNP